MCARVANGALSYSCPCGCVYEATEQLAYDASKGWR